jgi:hypothetical protein
LNKADFSRNWQLPGKAPKSTWEATSTFDARARAILGFEACDLQGEFRRNLNYPGEHWSSDALAMVAYPGACSFDDPKWNDTQASRTARVSKALETFSNNGQLLGSSMDSHGISRAGELDTALKDLMPILFKYPISDAAKAHMLQFLATYDAGRYTQDFDWVHGAVLNAYKEPETENHKLLIMSTRYLANDLIYASGAVPTPLAPPLATGNWPPATLQDCNNATNGMKAYWLDRLSNVLRNDFKEYNAKPYTRYTLDAIENLAELASDPDIRTAATAVLDFSAAKYAVASSMLRRESPYRRRPSMDSSDFFVGALEKSMDEQACRFQLYAGTTDTLNSLFPDGCRYVARQAVGSYRVPPMIVELALNKQQQTYFQTIAGGPNHAEFEVEGSVEIYDNEGPFLIAGGGIHTASGTDGYVLGADVGSDDDDKGIPVPAVILPNRVYADWDPRNITDRTQTVTIDTNLCIAPGFACGTNAYVPQSLRAVPNLVVDVPGPNGTWTFVNYESFYVVVYSGTFAPALTGPLSAATWGFMEAVPRKEVHCLTGVTEAECFTFFRNEVTRANQVAPASATVTKGLIDTYTVDVHYASPRGGRIVAHYDPMHERTYPVSEDRGIRLPSANSDNWPFGWAITTAGGAIDAQHDGHVKISVAGYGMCDLDLTTPAHPRRNNCDTPAPAPPPCVPKVCKSGCGKIDDGCGWWAQCPDIFCGSNENYCGVDNVCHQCVRRSCDAVDACGAVSDGCGGTMICNHCSQGFTCNFYGRCVVTDPNGSFCERCAENQGKCVPVHGGGYTCQPF